MTKKKVLVLIPLLLIGGLLLNTWIFVLSGDNVLVWRHYTGLVLFFPLIYLFTKNLRHSLLGIFIYLILGVCNLLTLTPSVMWSSYGIMIGELKIGTPPFQLISFGILILMCILNFYTLKNIYMDFKQIRQTKMRERIQVDDEGVLITGTNFTKNIAWYEITQMNAFKNDFFTWDRVELEIFYGDKTLTINEDVEGWNDFVIKIKQLYATIPHDWDTAIVQPPFETNFRTIYSKA